MHTNEVTPFLESMAELWVQGNELTWNLRKHRLLQGERALALAYLPETPDVIQAGRKNSTSIFNKWLKAECSKYERLEPLGASGTREIHTHSQAIPQGLPQCSRERLKTGQVLKLPGGPGLGEGSCPPEKGTRPSLGQKSSAAGIGAANTVTSRVQMKTHGGW